MTPPPSQPPPRLPTGAMPSAPAPEDERTAVPTVEAPPVRVNGVVQWQNLPTWGKWLGGFVVAIATSVTAAWGIIKPVMADYDARNAAKAAQADARAAQAKQASEAGYQVTKDYVQGLERRLSTDEAAIAALKKRLNIPPPRHAPPITPPRPRPLPHDLNSAEAQISKAAPPAPSASGSATRPTDAGP